LGTWPQLPAGILPVSRRLWMEFKPLPLLFYILLRLFEFLFSNFEDGTRTFIKEFYANLAGTNGPLKLLCLEVFMLSTSERY
jgi:hypothetical protein